MTQITIKRITTTNLKKDGTPILTKAHKPLYRTSIDTIEEGWISALLPYELKNYITGTLNVGIYEEEFNGKMYKKFKLAAADVPEGWKRIQNASVSDPIVESIPETITNADQPF